jgi:diaminopimelate decarboxylase
VDEYAAQRGISAPALVIEPGRSVVGEAGIMLYTAGSVKDIPGLRNYAAVDGGMTDNIRPALYGAKYEAVVANKADAAADKTVTICGKCCESGDILIKDAVLPAIEPGDTIVLFSTGAYGYSMASNYNRIPKPAMIMIKDGKARLVVKRETYADLMKNEL